ncbi:MAG: coproporphyrinogen dehydrogenase HemZ [Lachnospiraceae bacterium]|nr:coproporphyrinogen dehydrogenase HemZ [Lachnospiraceae bacterium]
MIEVKLNYNNFEYDIHSLIKSFFPEEDVNFVSKDETPKMVFWVNYEDGRIDMSVQNSEGQTKAERTILLTDCADYEADRKKVKNKLKIGLYEMLSEVTGEELPWGTLTGIRPVKIPYALLEENKSDEEIFAHMKSEYLASDKKIELSIEIAKREKALLSKFDYRKGYSLYVGIPFCPTRCLYCSFTSYPLKVWEKRVDEYVDALCKEIEFVAKELKGKTLNSVYMGGGTPTTLLPYQMDKVLKTITENFDFEHCQEFTVEAGRPDSITREKLEVLRKYGVERISVNPQTMNQKTLDLIGRRHTVEDTVNAYNLARDCGFTNINMDLITGLLGETKEDMEYTMKEIAKLKPDSLTLHSLALKRASILNERKADFADYESTNTEEVSDMLQAYAREMGVEPYYLYRQKNMTGNLENVGYSAPGKAGVYNILIMEEKQSILALGAGAVSKMIFSDGERIERIDNVKDVGLYIERIDEICNRKKQFFEEYKGELLWD